MGALADNPLRIVYNALWTLVEAQSQFTDEVPSGNRIKYTGTDRAPEKDRGLQPADYPEVRLMMLKFKPHLYRTSNGSSCKVIWSWQIRSGDQRFQSLLDVQWAIYVAMEDWMTALRATLEWNGANFTTLCRPLQADVAMSDDDKNKGWKDAWMGETELWFETTDLADA